MDSHILSKEILGKLGDISSVKVIQSSNTDELICKYVQDNRARITFFNGTTYEGPIIGGKLHGNGHLQFADKTRFRGVFKQNRISGLGEIHYSQLEGYNGHFRGFLRHGPGLYWHNGLKLTYEGNWQDNQLHGKGVLKLLGKWTYDGQFVRNKKHGSGRLSYVSGAYYEGEFQCDQKHGQGAMFWVDPQEVYRGQWIHNRLEGFGVYIYQTQGSHRQLVHNHYRGFFVNGQRNGVGTHFYSNGSVYFGEWRANDKHGRALFIDGSGEKFLLEFRRNRRVKSVRVRNSLKADERLGFVLHFWRPLSQINYSQKDLVNFVLNSKRVLKKLFQAGVSEFAHQTEECTKFSVRGVLHLFQKLRVFGPKVDERVMDWVLGQSEHNFIYTGYNRQNIQVSY